jgi:hypothetical protein
LLLCVFREAAESVDQLRLLDRIAAGFKKAGRIDRIREALCARDRSSSLINLFVELSTDALACDDSAIRPDHIIEDRHPLSFAKERDRSPS